VGIKTLERLGRLPVKKQSVEMARHLEARDANARRQAAWRANTRRGEALYVSQGYAEARARRLCRIERTATAELVEAYTEGRLSLRQYDQLSKLSSYRKRKAVESDRHKERAQNLAAAAIGSVLAQKPQPIDLGLIARTITQSIRSNC
jgi:hypothetical protein